ncbi:MAG: hypothetical protein RR655_07315, partial [Raoultibacter sp.]
RTLETFTFTEKIITRLIKKFWTFACIALGWGLLATWADLFGHSPGFVLPYSSLEALGNMRIYWLAGLFFFAAAMAAAPLWFERMRKHLSLCMPILASFGTLFFAVACQQTFFSIEVAAIIGIAVAGAGYGWFACLYCMVLAKTQKMVFVLRVPIFDSTDYRFRLCPCHNTRSNSSWIFWRPAWYVFRHYSSFGWIYRHGHYLGHSCLFCFDAKNQDSPKHPLLACFFGSYSCFFCFNFQLLLSRHACGFI